MTGYLNVAILLAVLGSWAPSLGAPAPAPEDSAIVFAEATNNGETSGVELRYGTSGWGGHRGFHHKVYRRPNVGRGPCGTNYGCGGHQYPTYPNRPYGGQYPNWNYPVQQGHNIPQGGCQSGVQYCNPSWNNPGPSYQYPYGNQYSYDGQQKVVYPQWGGNQQPGLSHHYPSRPAHRPPVRPYGTQNSNSNSAASAQSFANGNSSGASSNAASQSNSAGGGGGGNASSSSSSSSQSFSAGIAGFGGISASASQSHASSQSGSSGPNLGNLIFWNGR